MHFRDHIHFPGAEYACYEMHSNFWAVRCPQSMPVACLDPCDLRDHWVKQYKAMKTGRQSSACNRAELRAIVPGTFLGPTVAVWPAVGGWTYPHGVFMGDLANWNHTTRLASQQIPREFTVTQKCDPERPPNKPVNKEQTHAALRGLSLSLEFPPPFVFISAGKLLATAHTS